MTANPPLLPLIGRLASGVAFSLAMTAAAWSAPPVAPAQPAVMPAAAPITTTPAAAPAPNGQAFTVKIDNFTFSAKEITVPVGSSVTWINNDDIPHTVVSSDHTTFRSKVLDTDGAFTFTFTTPGEYPYFCSVHPHMTGKVTVR